MKARVEHVEHTADLAFRVFAGSLGELFATTAQAMFQQLADTTAVATTAQRHVAVEAPDRASLLVEWLNELLYLHEIHGEVYTAYAFDELTDQALRATVSGGKPKQVYTIIKGATYHNLSVRQAPEGLVATIVFDV